MKKEVLVSIVLIIALTAIPAFASKKGSMKGSMPGYEVVKKGNKICPVSGEWIKDGSQVEVQHNGKTYNLCCAMCRGDFKQNPEAFIKKIEEMEEEMNGHKGSHHNHHHDHDD